MPHFAASHLGLFCLPMSHKKDARLIRVEPDNHLTAGPCISIITKIDIAIKYAKIRN